MKKLSKDWINNSHSLGFNKDDKTGEPEVTNDPPEIRNNGETVEDHNTEISRHSIQKNCPGNYTLSNETSNLTLTIPQLRFFLAAGNTQITRPRLFFTTHSTARFTTVVRTARNSKYFVRVLSTHTVSNFTILGT